MVVGVVEASGFPGLVLIFEVLKSMMSTSFSFLLQNQILGFQAVPQVTKEA